MAKKKTTKKTTKSTKKKTTKSVKDKEEETAPVVEKTSTKAKKTTKKKTTKKKSSKKKTTKKTTKKKTSKKKTTKKTAKKTTKKVEEPKPKAEEVKKEKVEEIKEEPKLTEEEQKAKDEADRIEAFKKAGDIAKQVKKFIRPKIKVGAKLIDLVSAAEDKIIELGGKPGFPVNISLNNIAAHYTPPPGDKTEIQDGDVVKFDMGVHTGTGFSVDTAFTISFNKEDALKNLVKSSEDAVKAAIKLMKPGMKTNHVGGQIEKTVKDLGFKTIKDLSGHKIEQWDLHAGKSIPCVATPPGTGETIEEGEVYAIEVFSTNGEGTIHAQQNKQIFSLTGARVPLRNKKSKKVYSYIANEYKTLPFSRLQIYKEFPKAMFGLMEIIRSGKLVEHNVLAEKKDKGIFVSQHEHTVLITKDGCEVLT